MRRKPLWTALGFFVLFLLSRWTFSPPPEPVLAWVAGRAALAQGKTLAWFDPAGAPAEPQTLLVPAFDLLSVQDRMAYATGPPSDLILPQSDGTSIRLTAPPDSRGEGRWATWGDKLYHLQLRPTAIRVRDLPDGDWREFLAQDEEMENPVDLSAFEGGLLVLNQDPAEAVWFNDQGRSVDRVPLTRSRIWPIQRPVFASPLDYLRPRRADQPQRLWAKDDQTAAVLFTTANRQAPCLVVIGRAAGVPVREIFVALKSDAKRRKAQFGDFTWLPEGESLLTTNQGGLWLYGSNGVIRKEWRGLPPEEEETIRWTRTFGPWSFLLCAFIALVWAAWPSSRPSDRDPAWSIPTRAWRLGGLSLVLPGLGQAFQRRWGWVLFWGGSCLAWALLTVFLTHRLGSESYVSPATYIESWLGILGSMVGASFHAFWGEWTAHREKKP